MAHPLLCSSTAPNTAPRSHEWLRGRLDGGHQRAVAGLSSDLHRPTRVCSHGLPEGREGQTGGRGVSSGRAAAASLGRPHSCSCCGRHGFRLITLNYFMPDQPPNRAPLSSLPVTNKKEWQGLSWPGRASAAAAAAAHRKIGVRGRTAPVTPWRL